MSAEALLEEELAAGGKLHPWCLLLPVSHVQEWARGSSGAGADLEEAAGCGGGAARRSAWTGAHSVLVPGEYWPCSPGKHDTGALRDRDARRPGVAVWSQLDRASTVIPACAASLALSCPLLLAAHRAADVERVAPVGRGRVVRVATRRSGAGAGCVATLGNERPTLRRRGRHRLPNTTYGRPPDTGGCFLSLASISPKSYEGEKRRNYTLYEPTRQPFKEIAKLAHTSGETYKASPKRKTCAQRGTVHTATRLSMRMSMLAPTSAPAAAAAAEENSGGGTEGSRIRFRVSLHSLIRHPPSSPCTAAAACGPPCRLGLIARFPILRYKSFEASLPSAAIHPAYTRHTNLP